MRPTTPKQFTVEVKAQVAERSGGICELPGCGQRAVVFHHRLMRSQGGRGHAANALHLCDAHHVQTHLNPKDSYEQGLLIRSTDPVAASLR